MSLHALGVLGFGALALFLVTFIGRPLQEFFRIRRQISVNMRRYRDLQWHVSSVLDNEMVDKTDQSAFDEAQTVLGSLSDQLITLGRSQPTVTYFLQIFGFHPIAAGRHLAVMADELGGLNENRDANYAAVAHALRL